MKEHVKKVWDVVPHPVKEYVHTMLVGAGIGALTAGTAKIFHKLNVQHPAEPPKPHYQPKQTPRWQQRHDYQPSGGDWAKRASQSRDHRGDWHGR